MATSAFILYARKSTESEDRQVQSIPDQIALGEALALRSGFGIAETITESRSAKAQGSRAGFRDLIDRIERGEADGVITWHPDRLARNAVDGGWILDLLDRGKLRRLVFTSGYTFENTPEGKFMLGMIFSQSKYYVDKLSKDVRRGLDSKIAAGWFPHRAPDGYRNDVAAHTIMPDEPGFALLRRAWEMMLTGAYSGTQIQRALLEWGYRTKKTRHGGGKPMTKSAVYAMFHNPFYYGRFCHGGKFYDGAHTPMVSRDEWERVQCLIGRSGSAKPRRHVWVFAGMIRCGACGCLVTAERKVKRYARTGRTVAYTYYHCTGSRGCVKSSVSEAYLEEEVTRLLGQVRIRAEVMPWLLGVLERRYEEREGPRSGGNGRGQGGEGAAAAARPAAIAAARRRLDSLFDMRAEGEISREEYAERKARLAEELARLERSARAETDRAERERQALADVLTFCSTAYDRFTGGDAYARREVAALLAGIGVDDGGDQGEGRGGGESVNTDTNEVALSDAGKGEMAPLRAHRQIYLLTLGKLEITPHSLLDAVRTFEPLKSGSDKEKITDLEVGDPSWQHFLDHIGTSAFGRRWNPHL